MGLHEDGDVETLNGGEALAHRGDVADAANPPAGCYFHPRCPYAVAVCREETPVLETIEPGHRVACHRARELNLRGVRI